MGLTARQAGAPAHISLAPEWEIESLVHGFRSLQKWSVGGRAALLVVWSANVGRAPKLVTIRTPTFVIFC
jgi:hypothetical protein